MQTEFRSLYEITGKITDHNMLVVPAAKLKALTLYEKLAEEYGLSIFPDLEALSAEMETLRTGLAEARMEIESVRKSTSGETERIDMGAIDWDGYLPTRRYAIFHDILRGDYAIVVRGEDISRADKWGGFVSWLGPIRPEETRTVCKPTQYRRSSIKHR